MINISLGVYGVEAGDGNSLLAPNPLTRLDTLCHPHPGRPPSHSAWVFYYLIIQLKNFLILPTTTYLLFLLVMGIHQ